MTRGGSPIGTLHAPALLPCGAFMSPRSKSVRCQACYGRRRCVCLVGTGMACIAGQHAMPGSKNAHSGRLNRGFVDINANRRGMGSAK